LETRRDDCFGLNAKVSQEQKDQSGSLPSVVAFVRLIVARCSVRYSGRLNATLGESLRLLIFKSDGSVLVHADAGGYKPLNWMTPPTVIEEQEADGARTIVVRKRAGSSEDRLEIRLAEILSDSEHDMGSPDEHAGLAKDGVEADLQVLLAEQPGWCGEGFRLVRREWPTDIGPVDLMCRDPDDCWVAVEIKRVAGIEAVEQLTRYLERIRQDPAFSDCRGILAAQAIKPQARVLAQARGIACVEVDLAVLRGEREPDLKLFAA
jgi:RecB family endonuclease NucS